MLINKFEQYKKAQIKYDKIKRDFMDSILDYYKSNDEFRISHIGEKIMISIVDISKSENIDDDSGEFFYWIGYYRMGFQYDKITQSEFDEMMRFINNKNVYKSTKKYNM